MDCYQSIGYCTANEDGLEEYEICYQRTFLQWLFRKEPKKASWVCISGTWYPKGSKIPCNEEELAELWYVMARMRVARHMHDY